MTDQTPAGTRGAVDLSATATATPVPGAAVAGSTAGARPAPAGLVVELTASNVQEVLSRTLNVAGILVLWSSAHEQTRTLLDEVTSIAAGLQGRLLVITADVTGDPALMQMFQPLVVQAFGQLAVPATFGLLQGQPVPLFPGMPSGQALREAIEQLLQAAVANGITGRVELEAGEEHEEPPLPPLHQEAIEAIDRGDLAAAASAYERALAENPKDADAEVGLAQVRLLERTSGLDLAGTRARAAADPADLDAALAVADLDLVGGHVEDAFTRLLDLVRSTSGAERDRVRTHLIELFAVVGNHDERVRKGRTALMAALF